MEQLTFIATGRSAAAVLPKGTVITCSVVDKKQVYEIDGKPVPPPTALALDMVVDLSEGEPSKDDDFGTPDKKKQGDTWDLNAASVKKALEISGSGYQFDNIAGKATLVEVAPDSMKVSVHFASSVKFPVPQGFTLDQGSIDAGYTENLPTDASRYLTGDSEDIIITFTAISAAPSTQKIVAKTTVEKTMTRKIPVAK